MFSKQQLWGFAVVGPLSVKGDLRVVAIPVPAFAPVDGFLTFSNVLEVVAGPCVVTCSSFPPDRGLSGA